MKKSVQTKNKSLDKFEKLYKDITGYIHKARSNIVRSVNQEMIIAYWQIGRKIVEIEQGGKKRAEYGEKLLDDLSIKLSDEFGKGFGIANLKNMRQFYLAYQDKISYEPRSEFINSELNINLSWTHYRILMRESRKEVRNFYEIEAAENSWSTPELERQMSSLLYERLAKSKDKAGLMKLSKKGHIAKKPIDILKDPVVLEFLNIPESHRLVESKLEEALITHLQSFLLELGKGFAFVARQKRITLNGDHFYPDLVFYHVVLKCYVIIDLKTQKLTHQDIGQMQMYVNYFDQEIVVKGDNPTIGLLLCAEKNNAIVEYTLGKGNKQIFASKYQFHLPTIEQLKDEIKREIKEIQSQFDKSK